METLVDDVIDEIQEEILALALMLEEGEITVQDWEESFAAALMDLYLIMAAMAAGSIDLITDQMMADVQGRLETQYMYLEDFAEEIERGELTPGEIRRRSLMYVNSSRQAYWSVGDIIALLMGMTQERWLSIGDDAVCSPCEEAESLGWVPLGTLGVPGSGVVLTAPPTFCNGLTSCRCQKERR